MRIPTLREQLLGDVLDVIRKKRAEMNQELHDKIKEALEKKKEQEGAIENEKEHY